MNIRDKTTSPIDRFYAQIKVLDDGCWIWLGHVNGAVMPRGDFHVNGKRTSVTRFSYSHFVGEVKGGQYVCHTCDVPLCVNPRHLFLGTHKDNMDDMCSKGRSNKGEDRPASKLTEDAVRYIRRNYRPKCPHFGAKALARKFNVHYYTVWCVISGKAWRHVST